MNDRVLTMFTVYDRPSDFPEHVVVRACWIVPGELDPRVATIACLYDTVEDVQGAMAWSGLYWLPRMVGDDPRILGTWM